MVREVHDPYIGDFDIPGPPARFSAWPASSALRADLLGEHNEDVLRSLAGLDDDDIAQLYRDGVLVRDPLLGAAENTPEKTEA